MKTDGSHMPRDCSECQSGGISNKRGLWPLIFSAQSSSGCSFGSSRCAARLGESLRALPVRWERLAAGTVQRELAEHAVVVCVGARPDRLRAVVGAARRGQSPAESAP